MAIARCYGTNGAGWGVGLGFYSLTGAFIRALSRTDGSDDDGALADPCGRLLRDSRTGSVRVVAQAADRQKKAGLN